MGELGFSLRRLGFVGSGDGDNTQNGSFMRVSWFCYIYIYMCVYICICTPNHDPIFGLRVLELRLGQGSLSLWYQFRSCVESTEHESWRLAAGLPNLRIRMLLSQPSP